jgi:hypothetical protein
MDSSEAINLRAALALITMPGGPSRTSARTVIKLARLAADTIEARLDDFPEIDLGELVDLAPLDAYQIGRGYRPIT